MGGVVRGWARALGAALAGLIVGSVLTLAQQAWRAPTRNVPGGDLSGLLASAPRLPSTFLAWVPRGLPAGFSADVRALPGIDRIAVVAENDVWLRRSWSAAGELVDDPSPPYRLPLDAAAVDPHAFAPFLPVGDRAPLAAVADGEAILGATSATLRGLGPGATLAFGGGTHVRVAAVLPDELVGAAELVVSRRTGRRLGIRTSRYLLVRPTDQHVRTATALATRLQPLLPAALGSNRSVQVRAPGDTPFFRAGDSVLPPVLVKTVFGEFAARPVPSNPGALEIDPSWIDRHLVTTDVPVLGTVTCHRGVLGQLRGAMRELAASDLEATVRSYHGCYVPRFIGWDDTNMLSYHSWGIAFDLNLRGNLRGAEPHQDPSLVAVLERWGFQWGGRWIVPDGNHFEYRRTPVT